MSRSYYIMMLLEFLMDMKWVGLITIILLYKLVNRSLNILNSWVEIKRADQVLTKDYNEEAIVAHLDKMIEEELNRYEMYELEPKEIVYINSKMEDQLVEMVKAGVQERLSNILIEKLSMIYNTDYVGTYIGKYIHMKITTYVVLYNKSNSSLTDNAFSLPSGEKR